MAVVSETLVRRFFPNTEPIGQQITMSDDPNKGPFMTIVGVVNDVKFQELGGDPAAEMYCDFRQLFFAPFAITITLRAQSADPMSLAPAVQREIRALNPDQVISDVRTMRNVVFLNVAQPPFYTILLGVFAGLALLLAAAGLYGVLAYSVSRRISEIGIRVALGAAPGSVLRIVISEALLLVGAGICRGLAGRSRLPGLSQLSYFKRKRRTRPPSPRSARSCWRLLCGQLCPGPASPEGRPGHRAPLRVTGFLLLTRAVLSARFLAGVEKQQVRRSEWQ